MSIEISEVVIIVAAGTLIVFLLLLFLLSFLFLFQRKQIQARLEKEALQTRYNHEVLQTQIEVQNATLQKIASELHDNIGQLLSVAKINLNILEETGHMPGSHERVVQANEIISLSLDELRALTKSFDGDFVKDFGLEESLVQELLRIRKTKKFETEFNVLGEKYSLGYEKEIVLFRISQEVLSNIMKHSKAQNIKVLLEYEREQFMLCITDNGIGFETQSNDVKELKRSGSGLRNMRRRAELIGGELFLQTHPGEGTKIKIELHLSADS